MTTVVQVLELAADRHRAGQLQEAEELYRQVLLEDPDHAVALYLLGLIAFRTGRNDLAIDYTSRALRIKPDYMEAHNNLGNVLASQGALDEAMASFQRALRLAPSSAVVHNNLANVLVDLKKLDAAVACYQQAVRLSPDFASAYGNLGLALLQQGRANEAASCFRKAMQFKANFREQYDRVTNTLAKNGNLDESVIDSDHALRVGPNDAAGYREVANLFDELGQFDESVASYRRALELAPYDATMHNSLGIALANQGKFADAIASHERALAIMPRYADAHYNLGLAQAALDRLDEAIVSFQQALSVQPDVSAGHNALGAALFHQGKIDEAILSYDAALRLQPHYATAHFNRALARLLLGRLEDGWDDYEWRWKRKDIQKPWFRQPEWDGSALTGRTILLYVEQGLGDTIQFVRYAWLLKEQGARVIVQCSQQLARLLTSCPDIDQVVAQGSTLPDFDVQAPLLSLPKLLGTTLGNIPARIPYLFADPKLVEEWGQKLRSIPGFKIGISWQGNPDRPLDRWWSIPLENFAALSKLPGVSLVSLQKGPAIQAEALSRLSITVLPGLDDGHSAFIDTAAVMKNLDLVISADTATAHLAGALGVPVWVALSLVPDWRWFLDREDSPWYPTMRLFRQKARGNWQDVFSRIAIALAQVDAEGPRHVSRAPG
jgi:tetratricopeptide (TPR) repeat protein